MLTITHVDTTSDLRYARVYVSALNCPDEKEADEGAQVRRGLPAPRSWARRSTLRYTPELQFFLDESIAHGAHILDMLSHVKPANPANADIVLPDEK